jgi:Domain of unknown function (DUF222)
VRVEAGIIFDQARKSGSREPLGAYAAEALFSVTTSGTPAPSPRTIVHVRVDHDALRRGHLEDGEISEIASSGAPVPIPVVSDLMTDAGIKVIFHHAEEISKIYHFTRTINATLRTALEDRDPCCVIPGCGANKFLQIDHAEELGQGGRTCLANTARLCTFHHHQKTVDGFVVWKDDEQAWHFDPPAPRGEGEADAGRLRRAAGSRAGSDDGARRVGGPGDGASGLPPPLFELE